MTRANICYVRGYHCNSKPSSSDDVMYADAELMASGLLRDHKILASLGHNLVRLDLTAYSDSVELTNIDLDCLSSMRNLQQLDIDASDGNSVWHSQGHISSLTALESFTFLGSERNLHGPLLLALGMLPKLTQLIMPWLLGGNIELCNTSFSALENLHITGDSDEDEPSHVSVSITQPFDRLCNLCLVDCYITSAPIPFAVLPHLTRVDFKRCVFASHNWVLNAF